MTHYLILKWLHILSSVVLVGTGFGSAFYLFFVNRSKSLEAQVVVSRLVCRADWWFTTPTVILQPITGIAMATIAGWPLTTPWIMISLVLYVFAGVCWLPVVWIQLRMAKLAQLALQNKTALPPEYWKLAKIWERLGYPAFFAMVAIFYLMVAKPNI
jgi:uncharacterized membrane protein